MFFFITTGTPEFMEKVQLKNNDLPIVLLNGQGNSVLMYESEKKKSVFATPRKFEVLAGRGVFEQRGFVAFENIPVADEERLVFEESLLKNLSSLQNDSSCIAYRVLRPIKAETYLIVTQWAGPASYEVWKESSAYIDGLARLFEGATSPTQTMFTSKAYSTTYSASVAE